jgi:hypothetical protein
MFAARGAYINSLSKSKRETARRCAEHARNVRLAEAVSCRHVRRAAQKSGSAQKLGNARIDLARSLKSDARLGAEPQSSNVVAMTNRDEDAHQQAGEHRRGRIAESEENRRRERGCAEGGSGHVATDRRSGDEHDGEQRRAERRKTEKNPERRRDALPARESEEAGIEVAEERCDADERDRQFELPVKAMRQQISSAIDLIIQANRLQGGPRKITHITEVMNMEQDVIIMQEVFRYKQLGIDQNGRAYGQFEATGVRPTFINRLESKGIKLPSNMFAERILMRD